MIKKTLEKLLEKEKIRNFLDSKAHVLENVLYKGFDIGYSITSKLIGIKDRFMEYPALYSSLLTMLGGSVGLLIYCSVLNKDIQELVSQVNFLPKEKKYELALKLSDGNKNGVIVPEEKGMMFKEIGHELVDISRIRDYERDLTHKQLENYIKKKSGLFDGNLIRFEDFIKENAYYPTKFHINPNFK